MGRAPCPARLQKRGPFPQMYVEVAIFTDVCESRRDVNVAGWKVEISRIERSTDAAFAVGASTVGASTVIRRSRR